MGPRLFRRGNLVPAASSLSPLFVNLQWGHAFSGVETIGARQRYGDSEIGPSMGPRLFRRGNREALFRVLRQFQRPSMGPRLFRRGNTL